METSRQIQIFDTTLRDGQQCPGAGMSFENNLQYAELARKLRIDVLEAGFPSASKLDFEIVHTIANDVGSKPDAPVIAGLCQLREEQVVKTIEALLPAVKFGKARMHVYVAVDPKLMPLSLGSFAEDKAGIVRDLAKFVELAVRAGLEVEFSPEGYSRAGENFDFTTDLIRAAIQSGARVINCPDTIGGAYRLQGKEYFVEKMKLHATLMSEEFPQNEIIWSTHCHNDFGLALDNSLNAVFHGPARQIEGCINAIGERAGNVSLEQCVMVIKHFGHLIDPKQPLFTQIRTEHLQEISDFVHTHMLRRQPHWPISGDNAAKHSSGGHTNAVLKDPLIYQPFNPREIGKEISLIFGPLSGGNHAKSVVESFGYKCDDGEKAKVAQYIKDIYSERRKGITDEELLEGYFRYREPIAAAEFDYSKSANRSEIYLKGRFFDSSGEIRETHDGKDSALAALKKAIDTRFPGTEIQSHKSASEGEGINAVSVSTIVIRCGAGVSTGAGNLFTGVGKDQDIEISAMKALIDAVNRAYIELNFRK